MKNTAVNIVKRLQQAGFETYWAGGCVRDLLMGIEPQDYDIVTSANPDQVKELMSKTIEVGKAYGVIVAQENGHHFEIATFRGEAEYSDARHPKSIYFTNAKNDAERRDFTINGMFFDPITNQLIDYVGGQDDLTKRTIRFISNPDERIKEDHLRILRAIRFKNVLGFQYDKATWTAIYNNSALVSTISNERVSNELNKMFSDKHRDKALLDLSESGVLKHVLPEIDVLKGVPQPTEYHKEGDVFIHTMRAIKSLPEDASITLVWAVLLHDAGKAMTLSMPKDRNDRIRFNKHVKFSAGIASVVAHRLRFPKVERDLIVWLVKNHMIIGDIPKMAVAKRRRLLMDPRFPWLMELHKADVLGTIPENLGLYDQVLELYNEAKKLYLDEQTKPKFIALLNGGDIMRELGIESGPEVGKLLHLIEDAQLEEKIKTKSEAIEFLKKNYIFKL